MKQPLFMACRAASESRASPGQAPAGDEVYGTQVERAPGAKPLNRVRRIPSRMRRDLMEILCCPVCKGDLELKVDVEKDEILEGSLFCKACDHRYVIRDGIPDLLPPDFT